MSGPIVPAITFFVLIALAIWGARRMMAAPMAPGVAPELSRWLYAHGYRLERDGTEKRTSWTAGWIQHAGHIFLDRARYAGTGPDRWSMWVIFKKSKLLSFPGLQLTLRPVGASGAPSSVAIDTGLPSVIADVRYERRDDPPQLGDERRWLEAIARASAPLLAAAQTSSLSIAVSAERPRVHVQIEWSVVTPTTIAAGRQLVEATCAAINALV